MPYIKQELREQFRRPIAGMSYIASKGELEYCAYLLMLKYMEGKEYRYNPLHDAVYALIHSAEEFKRNHLDKREEEAMRDNGDITLGGE